MYIIEKIDPETGTVIQTIATATNAIIGRAAFDAACAYDRKAFLIYRIKARVIGEGKSSLISVLTVVNIYRSLTY